MAAYLHPADAGGRAFLAPAEAPVASNPPPASDIDATKVPAARVVVFTGGIRTVAFTGGIRTVRF